MIKAVFDTNVIISALFWKGAPYEIFKRGINKDFLILVSLEIIKETRNKLINKFNFPEKDTDDFIELLIINAKIIVSKEKLNIVKKDYDDNKIIECAVSGKAHYVISGDKHLLQIKEYNKIKIITPNEFLKLL